MVFLNFFPFFSQEKFLLQKDYKTSRQLLENDNLYFGANLSFVCRLAGILCSGVLIYTYFFHRSGILTCMECCDEHKLCPVFFSH